MSCDAMECWPGHECVLCRRPDPVVVAQMLAGQDPVVMVAKVGIRPVEREEFQYTQPVGHRTLNWYQDQARRTAPREEAAYPWPVRGALMVLRAWGMHAAANMLQRDHDVLIWSLGIAGEAGEVADCMKKVHGHGKKYDADKLKFELGDVLWYLANLANAHGFTLEEVAQANVDKLASRYPAGFTVAAAEAKADEQTLERLQGARWEK